MRAARAARRRASGRDHGHVLVIEAMILAVLLVATIVALHEEPRSAAKAPGSRRDLTSTLQDWLRVEGLNPDPTGAHPSMLDRMVAEALAGNATLLGQRAGKVVPVGTKVNAFLDNAMDVVRLKWEGSPGGEAVSASVLWSPPWGTVQALPSLSPSPDANGTLDLVALPLHRARGLTTQPGLQVEVELELPGGQRVNRTAFVPLTNRTSGPSATLSFLDAAGARAWAVAPGAGNGTFYLRVAAGAGQGPVPSGARVEVWLPPGFVGVGATAGDNPGWTGLATAGSAGRGWNVTASLDGALAEGASRQLKVNATAPPWGPLHLVEARLDGGSLGQFRGLLKNGTGASASAAVAPGRGPFVSAPGTAPWAAPAPVAVVVAYPDNATRSLTVTRVGLVPRNGASVASATGVEPASGWTLADGAVAWTGARALANDGVLAFRVDLAGSAPADGGSGGPGGLAADLGGGAERNLTAQRSPGLYAARVAVGNGSADGLASADGSHAVALRMAHLGGTLLGNLTHAGNASSLLRAAAGDLARGLDESWLALDATTVALGESATATWNVSRLVAELGVQGGQFKCYQPGGGWSWTADRGACGGAGGGAWQWIQEAPAVSLRLHRPGPTGAGWPEDRAWTGLAQGGSQAIAMPRASLLGTHAVELRVEARANDTAGNVLTLRATLLGAFDVHVPGIPPPVVPQYRLVVQAWLPDWG